jgi:hypothetical protein
MKGIGDEPIYHATVTKGTRAVLQKDVNSNPKKFSSTPKVMREIGGQEGIESHLRAIENDSETSQPSYRNQNEKDELIEQNIEENDMENESNKSELQDEGTMNVFGFNDDLNLDDRVIVQNATDNQIYQVVERPKYLL